jgi:succinyl-CoA synthetase beta subunit
MRLYEYEAKKLFQRHGISIPDSIVITPANIHDLEQVVYPVMIKAQVFLGKRGKAGFVRPATTQEQARSIISGMLGKKHGPFTIEKVLVERQVVPITELYLAATIDRLEHKPLIITSCSGGMEIEEIARRNAKSIKRFYFKIGENLVEFQARNIASELKFSSSSLHAGAAIVRRVYELFIGLDCKLVEINPLVITDIGKILALDAKIDLDEDAMFRHPELKELGIHARHEVGELTPREQRAKEQGIPYVDLDGDIGVFPGGAGFGIAAIDLIAHYGGKPANFMDSGGAPAQEKLRAMLGLLIDNPCVKAIFGARFGGISRCDDWAKALVQYVKENKPHKPMIMRMAGNMEHEGRKILEQAKQDHPDLFRQIKIYAVDTPIENVIQETIKAAKTSAGEQ